MIGAIFMILIGICLGFASFLALLAGSSIAGALLISASVWVVGAVIGSELHYQGNRINDRLPNSEPVARPAKPKADPDLIRYRKFLKHG